MKRTSIKKGIFICIAAILGIASSFAQTITNVTVDASACTGRTVSIAFTPTGFAAGTSFTAQLSDASGAFTAPVEIGTGATSPIEGRIPSASAGNGYKVRVVASTPAVTSSVSGNLNVKITPPAPTGNNLVRYCVGQTAVPLTASGENLKWYAGYVDGAGNNPELGGTPTPSTSSTQTPFSPQYYVTQTVDGCESGKFGIAVVVRQNSAKPVVTDPVPICQNTTVNSTILTNAVTGYFNGSYFWYESENGTGSLGTVPPAPSTSVPGSKDYYVTYYPSSSCESPKAKVTLIVKPAPSAPTVSNKAYTVGQKNIPALVATGTGSFYWFTQETGGVGLTAGPVPSTDKAGTTSYWVSQTVDNCESPRAKLDVVVSAAACETPAPTVASITYCLSETAVALTATGTALKWYTASTGETALAAAPTPVTTTAGTTSYYVSQTLNGCEGPRAKLDVIVNPQTPAPAVVSPINYTVGTSNAVPLTATGTSLKWYTAATGGTALASAPTPSTATAGTTSYFVSQTLNGCEGPRAEIVVSVATCTTPAPAVVSPVSYATGATNAVPLTATGTALKWYTVATGGTALAAVPTPSTTTAGTTPYYVSQTLNGCEGPRAKIDVVVTTAACATAAPTVVNIAYCFSETAVALTATGTALKWYTAATGGAALASAPTPSTTTAGTTSYYVSQTLNGCEGPRAKLDVTVNPQTPAPAVVSPVSYATGATNAVPLTATGTALKWYTVATGGTALAAVPTPSTTTAGTTSYYVSQTLNGCEGLRAKIDVVVTTTACATAAPTVVNLTYCFSETAVALTATGTALKWYTAATGGTALASAPTPSTTTAGTTSYYVSQTLNGCEGPRAKLDVTVNPQTPAPAVVSPVSYATGATNAVPLTATGTALKWYIVATGGTALAAVPTPSTTTAGTTSYYVSQTLNGCEGPRAKVDVVVTTTACATAAPTVVNLTYCFSETAVALTATGTALKWYTAATGGTALASAPTPSTTTAGTTSYYVSQTLNGCEGPRAKLDVTVNPQTPAPTVTNVTYCLSETAVALTATGTALKWYAAATGGIALTAAPVPVTTAAGTKSYYVSQTLNGCESIRAKIDVVVNPLTAAPTIGEPLVYCFNETAIPLKATGTALKWYTAATGGTALASAPTPLTTVAGVTSYYVSQTLNTCEGARAKVDVTVKPQVPAPTVAAAPIEYCQAVKAVPLTATPATGGILSWYGTNATGGTASATAPTPSTENEGTTSYYVNQKDADGCLSGRAKIDVKINVTPKPTLATSFVEYCQGKTASPLSATGDNLKWYLTKDATDFRTSPLTPFTEKVEDYSFYVTQTGANTCESQKAEIKVHIKPLPSATISGSTSVLPDQSTTITINFTGDGPWSYTLSDGQTGTSANATTKVTVTPKLTTNYVVTQVSNACGAGISVGVAVVTVLIPTITTGSPSVAELCAGRSFTVPFQKSGDFPSGNAFTAQISTVNDATRFVSIPSSDNGSILTAVIPDTVKAGSYFIRVVSAGQGGTLPGGVSPTKIKINPLPVATITGPSNVLMGQNATLSVAITGDAPWTFNLNDGAKDTLISASISPVSVRISPKTTSVYQITSVSNGCGVGRGAGTFRVQVDPVLGAEPPVAAADWLKIYPTMIENKCTVEITGTISTKEAIVEIIDLNGRSLSKRAVRQKVTEVDFTSRPPGMYLLKVQNGDRASVQRIFKP